MKTYQKYLHALSWLILIAIKFTLALIGLLTVWIALQFDTWPRVLWLWGNDEGIPKNWYTREWHWYAIRNPVNNMRYLFKDRDARMRTIYSDGKIATGPALMEPTSLKELGVTSAKRWAWAGPYAGYRYVWLGPEFVDIGDGARYKTYSEIWIGWKIGSGVPGLGFTFQVRFKRKIGT